MNTTERDEVKADKNYLVGYRDGIAHCRDTEVRDKDALISKQKQHLDGRLKRIGGYISEIESLKEQLRVAVHALDVHLCNTSTKTCPCCYALQKIESMKGGVR